MNPDPAPGEGPSVDADGVSETVSARAVRALTLQDVTDLGG
jgi:hypothetical protein